MLTTFFRAVPRELFESAALDGASHFRILWRIVLPLSAPALVTLVVVNTLWVWNDLLIALVFLPSDELKTLMVGVTVFRSRYNLDVPVTMAGLLLAALPMLDPLPLRPALLHPRPHSWCGEGLARNCRAAARRARSCSRPDHEGRRHAHRR